MCKGTTILPRGTKSYSKVDDRYRYTHTILNRTIYDVLLKPKAKHTLAMKKLQHLTEGKYGTRDIQRYFRKEIVLLAGPNLALLPREPKLQ